MALNSMGMGFLFTARDMASSAMQRIGRGLDALELKGRNSMRIISTAFGVAAAGAISLAAGVVTLMSAFSAAQIAGTFEQTMARVGALSRATAGELSVLSDAALEAGLRTQFSPTQAAEGLAELAVRGFNANEAISALTGTLDLAQGGMISVSQSSATIGAALRAFSLDAGQAGRVTDQLLRISNITALQANELELALGNVARGAGVARQSIEEMLPAIGLVRNTGVQASVAASSVSSALIAMSTNAERFDRVLGRTNSLVDESTGEFRNFFDVILETSNALESRYTNQTDRARVATELFGRFGLTAFSAISRQLSEGIRNAEGQILRGADAIAYLRQTMNDAEGAAAEFRERLQNTFLGQITLLQGTIQTLTTVIGGPFGRAFVPILQIIRVSLTTIIRFFKAIPERAQTAIATLILFGAALATAAGAIILLGVNLAILLPLLKVAAVTIAVLTVALSGIVVVIGSAVAALGTFWMMAQRNLGRFGDFVYRTVDRVKLVWETLVDLFVHGGVRKGSKILDPQNRGLLQFALNVWAIAQRIRRFVQGISDGFNSGLKRIEPAVSAMVKALERLGAAFGFLGDKQEFLTSESGRMQSFWERGAEIGGRLADTIGWIAGVVERATYIIDGFVRNIDKMIAVAAPGVILLKNSFGELFTQLNHVLAPLAKILGMSDENTKGFRDWGEALAVVAGFLVGAFATGLDMIVRLLMFTINTVRGLVMTFQMLYRVGVAVVNDIAGAFINMADIIMVSLEAIVIQLAKIAEAIPPSLRPGFANDLIAAGERTRASSRERVEGMQERAAESQQRWQNIFHEDDSRQLGRDFARVFTTGVQEAVQAMPAATEATVEAQRTTQGTGELTQIREAMLAQRRQQPKQPIIVRVELDGSMISETIRSADENAGRQVGTEA